MQFNQNFPRLAAGRFLDGMNAGTNDFGCGRATDGLNVDDLAIIDQHRAGGIFIFCGIGFHGAADTDQFQSIRSDLIDKEAFAGTEMTVKVLTAVGGNRHAQRAWQFAFSVGVDRGEVAVVYALAPQEADSLFQCFGFDADMASLLGIIASQDGAQIVHGQCAELGFR